MGRLVRMGAVASVVASMLSTPTVASAGSGGAPPAKRIATITVRELGDDAIPATLLALDQGYSGQQLIDAAIDVLLQPSGLIVDRVGEPVQPTGEPAGVITGEPADDPAVTDTDALVSIETVREAVPEKRRAAIEQLSDILVAAVRGYPVEAVIVDGLLADGFSNGFNKPGIIRGVPKPGEPPEPDLLDDLLADLATHEPKKDKGNKKDKGKGDAGAEAFTGELKLGANWANSNGVGTPTVSDSNVELRNEDDHLVGTYTLALAIPPEGGANCATTATYEGTFDLPPDGPGWTGTAQGTWTWTIKSDPKCGAPPAVYSLNWEASVLRVSDELLSGEMRNPTDGQGMTMTFGAQRG